MKALGGPCFHCNTRVTPCWRKGWPDASGIPCTLCNSCGSRWMVKKDLTGYMPYMSGRASKYQTKAKQAKQLDIKSRATGAVIKRRRTAGPFTTIAIFKQSKLQPARSFGSGQVAVHPHLPAVEPESPSASVLHLTSAHLHKQATFVFRRRPRKQPSPEVAAVAS